jgi:hypothetical protein
LAFEKGKRKEDEIGMVPDPTFIERESAASVVLAKLSVNRMD